MSYQEQTTQDQTVAPIRDEKLATHDLFETIKRDHSLGRFVDLLAHAGLDNLLRGPDLLTVLAPVDDAFDSRQPAPGFARDFIVPGAATADELKVSKTVKTLNGTKLSVSVEDGNITVGGARLVRADIECTNGVIHVIDSLLRA